MVHYPISATNFVRTSQHGVFATSQKAARWLFSVSSQENTVNCVGAVIGRPQYHLHERDNNMIITSINLSAGENKRGTLDPILCKTLGDGLAFYTLVHT